MMGAPETVLYVDDNKDDAFFFGRAFEQIRPGCQWRHVPDTSDARCYLLGEGAFSDRTLFPFPEIVISDAKMTDGTGVELLKWMRARSQFRRLPFCLFTGTDDDPRRKLGKDFGENVCLFSKPSHPREWPEAIEHMLQWHSQALPSE